jgi:hypothetical protein
MRCTNIGVTCPGYVKRSVFVDERANIERRARRRKTIVSNISCYTVYHEALKAMTVSGLTTSYCIQASESASRDASSSLHVYDKPDSDTRFDLGQSNPQDYRYLQDVVLVPELTPTYHFDTGLELQNPINHSYTMPTNFNPGGSDMSTSLPGAGFGGSSINQTSNRGVQQTTKLENGPGSEHFPNAPSAQSTPVLGSESHLEAASTVALSSPSNYIEESSFFAEFAIESEHEMAFLVRHFSEVIGPWYEHSDKKCFADGY